VREAKRLASTPRLRRRWFALLARHLLSRLAEVLRKLLTSNSKKMWGTVRSRPLFVKGDIMRLDKYLKVTRLIKRRTVANEACDAEKISVNGKVARASYDVKVGDIIEINMGMRPLKVKVLNVTEHATKENAADNYTVIE
jgi:ribosomal 50S subunit-recycling heat shock protein